MKKQAAVKPRKLACTPKKKKKKSKEKIIFLPVLLNLLFRNVWYRLFKLTILFS